MITKIVRLVFFITLILELMIISLSTQFLIYEGMIKLKRVQSLTTSVISEQTKQIVKR